jgi:hypothetical protein
MTVNHAFPPPGRCARSGELENNSAVRMRNDSRWRFPMTRRSFLAGAALAVLAGCTSTYTLTLMPRNIGLIYTGEAIERNTTEAEVTISIENQVYTGTWVYTAANQSNAYVTGGIGFGSRRGFGLGSVVAVDNPQGSQAKALLKAPDGGGLRCDLQGMAPGRGGGGTCLDDKGLVYDVQIRLKENK